MENTVSVVSVSVIRDMNICKLEKDVTRGQIAKEKYKEMETHKREEKENDERN